MSVKAIGWVWEYSQSEGAARLVVLAIADCMNASRNDAWPSMAELCRKTRLSERGVQKAIRRLEEMGELMVTANTGRGRTNRYRIVMETPHDVRGSDSENPEQSSSRTGFAPEQGSPKTPNVVRETPNHVHPEPEEPEEEPEEKPARPPATPDPTPDTPPSGKQRTGRKRKAPKDRTPEQQAAFDTADRIAHLWWDEQCPQRGIPIIAKGNRSPMSSFPGFRTVIEKALDAGITETEIKNALIDCGTAWPTTTALTNAVSKRRGRNPQTAGGRPTNQHIESTAGDQLAEVFG